MNRSFELVEFFSGRKATFYTVLFDGEELTEGDKFLNNEQVKQHRDFADLKQFFFNILNKTRAERHFFRHEGFEHDMVRALSRGDLRWYCVRWSREMVIFGNGGIKTVAKTQDDKHLKESEYAMRRVAQCIDQAAKDRRFSVDYDGNIHGMTTFDAEE